jgi:hypothetical protein
LPIAAKSFLMAGREMTAWIAGLSFISANLGSQEMMGYAAATYQLRNPGRTTRTGWLPCRPLFSPKQGE